MQFFDSFGTIEDIKKAEARHREQFPSQKSFVESKKRPSLDNSMSDRAKVHKPYMAATATAAQAGPPAYNNGGQWNSYNQQSQGWQQPQGGWQAPQQPTPPVQPQQWNQGYGAQQVCFFCPFCCREVIFPWVVLAQKAMLNLCNSLIISAHFTKYAFCRVLTLDTEDTLHMDRPSRQLLFHNKPHTVAMGRDTLRYIDILNYQPQLC